MGFLIINYMESIKVLNGFPPSFFNKLSLDQPIFFGIHLKPACNFRCRKCFIGRQDKLKSKKETLSLIEIFTIIEKAKENGFRVLGITGAGEPLIDNRIFQIIEKAHSLGMTIHIPTNLSLLNRPTAEFMRDHNVTLVLSLDSVEEADFVKRTGTSKETFKQVLENFKMAQQVFQGTKQIEVTSRRTVERFRLAVHMTVDQDNTEQIGRIREMISSDTFFSVSELAAEAGCAKRERLKSPDKKFIPTEKHIVVTTDPLTGKDVCGFFRFGVDINFDGQILLDAHAIETRKVFPNIRDFSLDVKKVFDFMRPIKDEFVQKWISGFCPVRSPLLGSWEEDRQQKLHRLYQVS